MSHNRCSVVVADDHAVVRDGIKRLIELTERYKVVGEADTGEAAIRQFEELQPDLVIMDIRMPDMNGIVATHRITKRNPDARVLVLTAFDDPEYVNAVIEAGAMGCISKRRASSELVATLDMLALGRTSFPAGRWAGPRTKTLPERADVGSLSDRKRSVLFLTAAGFTANEIARRTYLSPKTVANYRSVLKKMLGARNRADLLRAVVESGHLADMLAAAGIEREEDR